MDVVGAAVLLEKGHLQKRKGFPPLRNHSGGDPQVGEGSTPLMAESKADLWAGSKAGKMAANTHSRTNVQSPLKGNFAHLFVLAENSF